MLAFVAVVSIISAATTWRMYVRPIVPPAAAGPTSPLSPGRIIGDAATAFVVIVCIRAAWRAGNVPATMFWSAVAMNFANPFGRFVVGGSNSVARLAAALSDSIVACVYCALVLIHVRRPFELFGGWVAGPREAPSLQEVSREPPAPTASLWGVATPILAFVVGGLTVVNPIASGWYLFTKDGLAQAVVRGLAFSVGFGLVALILGMVLTMTAPSSRIGRNLTVYGAASLESLFGLWFIGSQLALWFGVLD